MTQYIAPNMAMAMQYSNQQGMDPSNRYGSGILSLADGGFIGGGNIQGQAMPGGRTGFGILKKLKRGVKKLIPKELAGIMQVAAPFVAPHSLLGAGLMSGLGQYKQSGRISPLQLMMSMAPGVRGEHLGKFRPEGMGAKDNVIRNLMQRSNIGSGIDKTLFGTPGKDAVMSTTPWGHESLTPAIAETSGWLGEGGKYSGLGDLLKKGTEAVVMKGPKRAREVDKMALAAIGLAGASYMEAKKQMQLSGEDLEDYGIYNSDDWEAIDWSETFKDSSYLPDSFAKGGRAGYAHGGIHNARPGYLWGSDKGEGLGGEEVEADMRFTGGFMPYGEEPKADDVPARLSKDEFVFTDEAVKGAGQGDVNVGAERLFNMMKQLEQTGARNMEGIFNNPIAMA